MKLHFNSVVIGTFARLFAASEFVKTLNDGIPTVEEREQQYLELRAAQEGWDYGELRVEKDILDEQFRTWVPTFAAYSVVVLLYSILETQLIALADHLGDKCDSKLRVDNMAGKGIEQAATYLERVLRVPVTKDPAWCRIHDIRKLRNCIAHRTGRTEGSKKQELERLIHKYGPRKLSSRKADGFHPQLWISMNLCQELVTDVEAFFERIFKVAGLPNRHGQIDR